LIAVILLVSSFSILINLSTDSLDIEFLLDLIKSLIINIDIGINKIKQMYSIPRVTLVDSCISSKTDVLTKKNTDIIKIEQSK
jgi:hypothetical protein